LSPNSRTKCTKKVLMYDFFYKKVLAEGATKDYNAFEDNRKRVLTNARNRAKSAYQTYSAQLK